MSKSKHQAIEDGFRGKSTTRGNEMTDLGKIISILSPEEAQPVVTDTVIGAGGGKAFSK
jgi:hypothetical protein